MAWTRVVGLGGFGFATTRLGGEVERDAHDVGVFDVEQAVRVQVVGLPAQAAADHLLAQQLGAEGAHAEDVGDGVGVPSLGQHGDGDDAAHLSRPGGPSGRPCSSPRAAARSSRSPRRRAAGALALHLLAPELLDLGADGGAESRVQRLAGIRPARCRSAACSAAPGGAPCSS